MLSKKETEKFHTLVTNSPVILELLEIIDRAALTDSSVLILGESGVGKELFAEQVHLRSPRKDAPFIRVNCAAIPEGLLESELFGHVKGAFTNAVSDHTGRFEMAKGGTIFLDEIGDLPLTLQAKILRVIQEKKIEKVGSGLTINANARIVAATNKNLEEQVQKALFREDLYYRLNVLPVFIPPLRERREDIKELAFFFLDNFNSEKNGQFNGFSPDAIDAMYSYSWPGNVRELRNYVERACIICKNKWISRDDLFQKFIGLHLENRTDHNLKDAVNNFKAGFIRRVLEENDWNKSDASRALAIQRTYLSRLIKELKINEHKE